MEPRWRVGRTLGRTLYRDGQCVGMVDTLEVAAEIVAALNGSAPSDAAKQLERSLGVDMRVTPEARWGVFDVEERKWCPRFGSESQMSAHAAQLNASLRPDAGAAYRRYQPLPLPVPVRTETAG